MCICNVVLAGNQWSVFRNLDEDHAFFHSFVREHWAYGKNAILELECVFYLTFETFLEVCIRFFFFTCAVSSITYGKNAIMANVRAGKFTKQKNDQWNIYT